MFTSDMTWVSVLLLRVCMPPPPTAPPLTAATPNTLATLLPAWFTCACHIQLFHMCLCHNAISQQRFLKQLSSCLQLNVVPFFFVTLYHALFAALLQLLPNPPYKKVYIYVFLLQKSIISLIILIFIAFQCYGSTAALAAALHTLLWLAMSSSSLGVRALADINVNNLFISYSARTHCFLYYCCSAALSWVIIVHVPGQQQP